jgi:hypothetical protein
VACVLHELGRLPKCTLTAENEGGQLKVFLGAKRKAIVDILLEGSATILNTFDL